MVVDYGKIRAILMELKQSLARLRSTGETHTIYIEKTGLNSEEVVEVLETLGKGHLEIAFHETDQPVDWYETKVPGIWVGVFRNMQNAAIVYTVEVCRYPSLAQSFDEDMAIGEETLEEWIEAAAL